MTIPRELAGPELDLELDQIKFRSIIVIISGSRVLLRYIWSIKLYLFLDEDSLAEWFSVWEKLRWHVIAHSSVGQFLISRRQSAAAIQEIERRERHWLSLRGLISITWQENRLFFSWKQPHLLLQVINNAHWLFYGIKRANQEAK